jgi:hypothetical protein
LDPVNKLSTDRNSCLEHLRLLLFSIEHWKVRSTLVFHILGDFSVSFIYFVNMRDRVPQNGMWIILLFWFLCVTARGFEFRTGSLIICWCYWVACSPLIDIISWSQDNQLQLQIISQIQWEMASINTPILWSSTDRTPFLMLRNSNIL